MPLWLAVLFAACTVLALAGLAFNVLQSAPAQLRKQITLLRAEVQEQAVGVEAIGQRWLSFKAEMENLAEQIEDNLETVERKRKRAAAAASRAAAKENGQQEPMTPEQRRLALARGARQAGFEV